MVLRPLSVLLVALALVAVSGCGGGDDSPEEASAAETVAEETTTEATTTDEAETETDSSDDDTSSFAWASEDCQSLVLAYAGLSAAVGAASSGQDVSGDIEEFSDYVDKVPDEIRDDVETLAEAYGEFVAELEDIDFTPGSVPSADQLQALQAASESLGTADVQAAGERLSTWTTDNCS